MVSTSISNSIGGLNSFLLILLTATIGVFILKNFKFSLMESITKAREGKITQQEFLKTNVGRAIGAVLLIVPGFFTDFLGLLLISGLFISIFSKIFKFQTPSENSNYRYQNSNFEYKYSNFNNTNYKRKDDEIIDVEVIDDSKSIK
jgi:2-isopropylmalate synthase/UPF0716 protein FxsA